MKSTQGEEYKKAWAAKTQHRFLAFVSYFVVFACVSYNVVWELSSYSLPNYNFIFISVTIICLFFIKETDEFSIIVKRFFLIIFVVGGVLGLFLQALGLVIYFGCYVSYANNCAGFSKALGKKVCVGGNGDRCRTLEMGEDESSSSFN